MKILIDMNLSPEWVDYLQREGYIATHWRDIGSFEAKDIEITKWAAERDYLIFTNDLDFGRILALTHADGPSVIQVRGNPLLPEDSGEMILAALENYQNEIQRGALVTIDEVSMRIKVLPIKPIGRKIEL